MSRIVHFLGMGFDAQGLPLIFFDGLFGFIFFAFSKRNITSARSSHFHFAGLDSAESVLLIIPGAVDCCNSFIQVDHIVKNLECIAACAKNGYHDCWGALVW